MRSLLSFLFIALCTLVFTISIHAIDWSSGMRVLAQTPQVEQQASDVEARRAEGDRLLEEGLQQLNNRQLQEALQLTQQATAIYQEVGYREGEARALNNLGGIYELLGNIYQATETYIQIANLISTISEPEIEAFSLIRTVVLFKVRQIVPYLLQQAEQQIHNRDFESALQALNLVLKISQITNDRNAQMLAEINLGHIYNDLHDYQSAIEYFQQGLNTARELDNHRAEISALVGLGTSYNLLKEYSQARDFLEQAIKIAQEINDYRFVEATFSQLLLAYTAQERNQQIVNLLNQFDELIDQSENREIRAYASGLIGGAYFRLGQYQQSTQFLSQALEAFREIGEKRGETQILISLGDVYDALAQYDIALQTYQQAFTIAREINDYSEQASALVLGGRSKPIIEG